MAILICHLKGHLALPFMAMYHLQVWPLLFPLLLPLMAISIAIKGMSIGISMASMAINHCNGLALAVPEWQFSLPNSSGPEWAILSCH